MPSKERSIVRGWVISSGTPGQGQRHKLQPRLDLITEQARDVIAATVPAGTAIEVRLVWDPPWTPDRMTGIARAHFGWV